MKADKVTEYFDIALYIPRNILKDNNAYELPHMRQMVGDLSLYIKYQSQYIGQRQYFYIVFFDDSSST